MRAAAAGPESFSVLIGASRTLTRVTSFAVLVPWDVPQGALEAPLEVEGWRPLTGAAGRPGIMTMAPAVFLTVVSDIFVDVFMPTTVHIPPALLKTVDRRAKALGVSRNRLIVRALEQAVSERTGWAPEFLARLRKVDRTTSDAVDELLSAVKARRRSKAPRDL